MRSDFDFVNDVCILRLKGRLIAGLSSEYARTQEEFARNGWRKVIADCRDVPYCDAAGIGFLAGFYRAVRDSGGRLVLANANQRLRDVLDIARLTRIIPVCENEQAALDALSAQQSAQQFASAT